ncbi:MAG: general secretion pathway protein GspE [Desulfuromonadales bacterium]|nr:MAG: general secretion pathway protein GspE [Desulfuromonadales bacterium]
MAVKLGEMLVKAGMITPAQLDEALKSQVIFGGRLGTNLIEMACIDEDGLAQVLSEKLRVPRVDPDELMNISPDLIALVPRDMVEQYKVIPLRLEGRRLFLVMADPSDLSAMDEIAFRTGLVILPMVAPELRLILAMEKYYDIRREMRFIPVSKELGGRRACSYRSKPADVLLAPRDVVDFAAIPGEADELVPWNEDAEPEARIAAAERYTIDALSQELADVRDRDAVATALVRFVGQEFDRAALLMVMNDCVTGWEGITGGEKIVRFPELRIGHDEPSAVQTVIRNKSVYLGTVVATPANERLIAALGGGEIEGLLLVPMQMNRRVVTILCAAGPLARLGARMGEFQKLAHKGVLAFEVLILKNKILMT